MMHGQANTKPNSRHGQKADFLKVKPGDTYSNHKGLKG